MALPEESGALDAELFIRAQDAVWDQVLLELRNGRKVSHWMWLVFPQLAGLGHSATSRRYALHSLEQARDWWNHPVLGPRLLASLQLLDSLPDQDISMVLGGIDAMKLRSSLTLFETALQDRTAPWQGATRVPGRGSGARVSGQILANGSRLVASLIERYYGGERDPLTLKLLAGAADSSQE